jgi:hypothetical protein
MYPSEAHMKKREHEKLEAIESLEVAIAHIETLQREPDKWERLCLVRGTYCVFSGAYELAKTESWVAMTPLAQRSPQAILPSDSMYEFGLAVPKTALHEARKAPAEPYTRFGPVVLGPNE